MKTTSIILLALISIGHIACVNRHRVSTAQVEKRYTKYGVTPLLAPWVKKSFRGADLYYEHSKANASILVNAYCDKVSDSPLEALLAQELIGLTDIRIEKEQRLMIADREALVSEMEAKLDGVPRFIKIMVLKKNRCVYDALFNSPIKERYLVADFDRMLESLSVEAEL